MADGARTFSGGSPLDTADAADARIRALLGRPAANPRPIDASNGVVEIAEFAAMGLAEALNSDPPSAREREADEPRRKARVRAQTISIKRLSKRELERGRMLFPETEYERPRSRGDCLHGSHAERPCPFVSCKHHLFLDVNDRTGSIKLNFPDLEVWDLPETCALDIADRGGITLEEVGAIMNLTRERIRQLETRGLAKLASLGAMSALSDFLDDSPHNPPCGRRVYATDSIVSGIQTTVRTATVGL